MHAKIFEWQTKVRESAIEKERMDTDDKFNKAEHVNDKDSANTQDMPLTQKTYHNQIKNSVQTPIMSLQAC